MAARRAAAGCPADVIPSGRMCFSVTVGQAFRKAVSTAFFLTGAANAVTCIAVGTVNPACGIAALGDPGGISGRTGLGVTSAADTVPVIAVGDISPPGGLGLVVAVAQSGSIPLGTRLGGALAANVFTGITVGRIGPPFRMCFAVTVGQSGGVVC